MYKSVLMLRVRIELSQGSGKFVCAGYGALFAQLHSLHALDSSCLLLSPDIGQLKLTYKYPDTIAQH